MDGVEQLTRFCPVGGARQVLVAAFLLVTACGSGIRDGSPNRTTGGIIPSTSEAVVVSSTYEVLVAETMSLEEGLRMLEEDDAAIIHNRVAGEPRADLPDHAIAWAAFDLDRFGDSPQRTSKFLVANYWPRRLRVNVICLVGGRQVPCSDDATVWRVELDEPGMAILDIPEAEVEGRRDVLLVEESDERIERFYPTSRVRGIDGYDTPFSILGDPLPEIVNPLGGCDWALLMDNLEPRDTFKPMRAVGAAPVHLVISICPEHSAYEMFPLFIIDETTVVHIEGLAPFMARPGAAYAWKLPHEILASGTKIRAAVVRRATGWGHWVTHPLVISKVDR